LLNECELGSCVDVKIGKLDYTDSLKQDFEKKKEKEKNSTSEFYSFRFTGIVLKNYEG
jgi:hypothetical protein